MRKNRLIGKGIVFGIVLLFVGASAISVISTDVPVDEGERGTLIVPDQYPTIQAAIDNASDGDTIYVRNGFYPENVEVTKSVNLIGEDRDTTIIEGPYGVTITCFADGINVTNFTIQNIELGSGGGIGCEYYDNIVISYNKIRHIGMGIGLYSWDNAIISNNIITDYCYTGISINYMCSNIRISDNIISNPVNPVATGISVTEPIFDITIMGNDIYGNNEDSQYGITGVPTKHNMPLKISPTSSYHDAHKRSFSSGNIIIEHNTIIDHGYGISLVSCNDFNISYNTISSNSLNSFGIVLDNSMGANTILGNTISTGNYGISLGGSDNTIISGNTIHNTEINPGISLGDSSGNTISGNIIQNNSKAGIWLSASNGNTITDNVLQNNNDTGIYLYSSSNNNIIANNSIVANTVYGIKLWTNNIDNSIYNNYFSNTINAYDEENNIWNITKTPGTNIIGGPYLGGNYWGDYAGVDTDGDGIGDTDLPYNSSGNIQHGGDYHPLTAPNYAPEPPTRPSGRTFGTVGRTYSYTTNTTDPDGDDVYYLWDWGDGTYSGWLGPFVSGAVVSKSHQWTTSGAYQVKVKAKDIYDVESSWSNPLTVRIFQVKPTPYPFLMPPE